MRDVAGLAECVCSGIDKGLEIDDIKILEDYMSLRAADQQRVMRFTNGLASSFYNQLPLLSSLRNFAMFTLDTVPELKRSFIEKTMGLAGLQPKLVRGQQT